MDKRILLLIAVLVNSCTVIPDEVTIRVEVPTAEEVATVEESATEEPLSSVPAVVPGTVQIVTEYGVAESYSTTSQSEWDGWRILVPQRCEQLTIQSGLRHWPVWGPGPL